VQNFEIEGDFVLSHNKLESQVTVKNKLVEKKAEIGLLNRVWTNQALSITELNFDDEGNVTDGAGQSEMFGPFKIFPNILDEPSDFLETSSNRNIKKVSFLIQPHQLKTLVARFYGFSVTGDQLTELHGIYQQLELGKSTIQTLLTFKRAAIVQVKILNEELRKPNDEFKARLIQRGDSLSLEVMPERRSYDYKASFSSKELTFKSILYRNCQKLIRDPFSENVYVLLGSLKDQLSGQDTEFTNQKAKRVQELRLEPVSKAYANSLETRHQPKS
jgi:hypothetical protein